MALTNERLARKVDQIENRVTDHDELLFELVREIRKLIETPKPKRKKRLVGSNISDKLKKES